MANNGLLAPQSMLQYNIRNVMGFAPALAVLSTPANNVTLHFAQYADKGEKTALVLQSPFSENEVFVVEAKRQAGLDASIPHLSVDVGTTGGGLLVYRVNKSQFGNAGGPPDGIYVFRPSETGVSAAQGDIQHAVLIPASAGCTTNRSALGKARGQESAGFDNDTLFFADGSNSGIEIKNLTYTDGACLLTSPFRQYPAAVRRRIPI